MFGTHDRVTEDLRAGPKSDDSQRSDGTPRELPPLSDGLVVAVEEYGVRSDVGVGALHAQEMMESHRRVPVREPHIVHDIWHDVHGGLGRSDDVTAGVACAGEFHRDECADAGVQDDYRADASFRRPAGRRAAHISHRNCTKRRKIHKMDENSSYKKFGRTVMLTVISCSVNRNQLNLSHMNVQHSL